MAKRRTPTRITLTDAQRERLERLWFIYGNYGPKTTPGNHQFIQGLLEHGLDLRPMQTKRTAKREIPTAECVAAVEAILAATDDGEEEGPPRSSPLKLVTPPAGEEKVVTHDPELKTMLDEMRRRLTAKRDRGGSDSGGKDVA